MTVKPATATTATTTTSTNTTNNTSIHVPEKRVDDDSERDGVEEGGWAGSRCLI